MAVRVVTAVAPARPHVACSRWADADTGVTHLLAQAGSEVTLHVCHGDSVLRSLRTTDRCHYGAQVDPNHLGNERRKAIRVRKDGLHLKHDLLRQRASLYVGFPQE